MTKKTIPQIQLHYHFLQLHRQPNEGECPFGYINYFWCEDIVQLQGCNYLFSVCNEGQGGTQTGDEPDSYVEDNVAVKKSYTWTVAKGDLILGDWAVKSYEVLQGIKVSSEPGGGHFTGITHTSAKLINYMLTKPAVYTLIGEYAWVDLTSTPPGAFAYSNVSGTVVDYYNHQTTFNPTQPFMFGVTFP